MLTAFFILAALLTIQSLIALQDGPRFLAFVRRRLQESLPDYAPPATLICPCKGLDEELEHNLTSLVEQDYPDLEIVFVMASGEDPARAVCDKVAAKAPSQTALGTRRRAVRVVIAGKPEGRGEKVNNYLPVWRRRARARCLSSPIPTGGPGRSGCDAWCNTSPTRRRARPAPSAGICRQEIFFPACSRRGTRRR
jgi:cellulose synthase/poly-beta-1,6-N-acetylglucosamine synthase-like glycosyltransferase